MRLNRIEAKEIPTQQRTTYIACEDALAMNTQLIYYICQPLEDNSVPATWAKPVGLGFASPGLGYLLLIGQQVTPLC
jgi:hypothetical protein